MVVAAALLLPQPAPDGSWRFSKGRLHVITRVAAILALLEVFQATGYRYQIVQVKIRRVEATRDSSTAIIQNWVKFL